MGGYASSQICEDAPIGRKSRPLQCPPDGLQSLGHETARELFNACAARGGKAWDRSAMGKALEIAAGPEVA